MATFESDAENLDNFDGLVEEMNIEVADNIEGSSSAYVSPIWKYFEKDRRDETKAKCKICDSFHNRSGSSTSNLIKHLKAVHKIDPGCRKVTKKVNASANKTIVVKRKVDTELDRLYVMWLCHDLLPFRTGESKYFQKFIAALKPDYVIPSRTKLSQCLVPELANEIQEKLVTILEQRDVADVVLTTDAWTSKSCDNYEALTAHFICKNFVFRSATLGIAKLDNQTADGHVKLIEKLVNKHKGLMERVTTLTSDNAEVMKSTCRKLKISWFGCIPHTINLVVKNGLNISDCANILASIRAIASHFRRSAKATALLNSEQKKLKLAEHK
ncbi:hypothetical protein OUZ56_003746 [Daphnia magna]|nr:hypothetical protein OUZ56_003974 [Daphnia magna]KAK4011500.1 hypothetical protein OUZ56_020617 [Daphnia magna]KAK4021837.1 hypothetical protein OUZ56_003746 [Daphnia magna]